MESNILKKGTINNNDIISPSYVNLSNPKYIEIDGTFFSSLIFVNYFREQNELILKNIIESNVNINISMYYEKQDTYKAIRELTYHIGNTGVDLKEKGEGNQDIDIIAFTHNDAKYIRKEMQINNQELYYLYIYVTVYSTNKEELEYLLNKVEGIIQGKSIQSRRAYFRQEQAFLSCIPLMENNNDIKQIARRNVLTEGLIGTFPFISSSICDENGIYIGNNVYNNSLVFIDRYNQNRYKNANMCIFGTSGAGKSFYTKLLILRYRLLNITQYVIDPEREYIKLCDELEGTLIRIGPSSSTYVNIFDIREDGLEDNENGYLANKIPKIIGFLNLVFGKINEEDKGILEEKIIKLYEKKGITFNDESLYRENKEKINIKKHFKQSKDMPILSDLYNLLLEDEKTKIFAVKLIPFVKGSLKFFNNYTNISLNNKLIIADIYELGEENIKYGMYIFTELFWDKIKSDRNEKKAIYLDEIWRLIGVVSNQNVASFIYKIFKTIRKYGGSAVAITQDISDLFSLEDGIYGKSIINNSSIKNFFYLEEENIKILEQFTNLSEKEKVEINSLKRGQALMHVGADHLLVDIEASDDEKNILE